MTYAMLTGLPQKYEVIVSILTTQSGELTLSSATAQLLAFEARVGSMHEASTSSSAFVSAGRGSSATGVRPDVEEATSAADHGSHCSAGTVESPGIWRGGALPPGWLRGLAHGARRLEDPVMGQAAWSAQEWAAMERPRAGPAWGATAEVMAGTTMWTVPATGAMLARGTLPLWHLGLTA
ncbi:hypothetical protein VaNZ11_016496 [Volvox africanus]|uniref:Uncharacterized protein n=1 Tax=Volvox africanus TaxID=51714 RepID=A0ABQ5SNY5_9CHLO|nr:hypothetical protein VaNZ11_016496 [Volvox africanus]